MIATLVSLAALAIPAPDIPAAASRTTIRRAQEEPVLDSQVDRALRYMVRMEVDPENAGFPAKRVPLKELNFCDIGQAGIPRKGSGWDRRVECPQPGNANHKFIARPFDPSCISCLTNRSLKEADRLWQLYSSAPAARKRREKLNEWYGDQPFVIVVASDGNYLKMLRTWYCNAGQHGASAANVLVYAFDAKVTAWAAKQGLRSLRPEDFGIAVPAQIASEFKCVSG
jgi:hypothetical protein